MDKEVDMETAFETLLEKLEKKRLERVEQLRLSCTKSMLLVNKIKLKEIEELIEIVKQTAEEFGTDTNVGSNGWIPCSERFPEKYNRVLAYTDAGGYYIAHVNGCGKFVCTAECVSTVIENSDVIAWQPLPHPYTKGE